MISEILKTLPLLVFGWSLGAAQLPCSKNQPKEEIRGVPELGNCCMARSCSCAHGMAIQFEGLYWRAENHGFSYALNEKTGGKFRGVADGGTPMSGTILRVTPSWDPGFRFGLGYNSDYDRWDLFANWTYYKNHASETKVRFDLAGQTTFDGYYPLWPVATENVLTHNLLYLPPFQTVHASWQMWHQVFDLELGRAYFLTKKFSVRPHIGGRGGWIRQKFYNSFVLPLQTNLVQQFTFHGRNNWWGVGPRVGLEGKWHIGQGLSILGRTSASALYGLSKVRFLSLIFPGENLTVINRRFSEGFFQVVPNFQLFLGAGWSTCLRRGQVFIGLDGGWEANYWWNQCNTPVALSQYISPLPSVFSQPVTMEGLTMNLHLDY